VDLLPCAELLARIEDESVDLVLVDPAYPSLEKHRAKGTTTRLKVSDASSNAWFEVQSWDDLRVFLREAFRVLRPARHAYVLCDDETSAWMRREGWAAGFYVWPALTWVKTGPAPEVSAVASPEVETVGVDDGTRLRIGMGYHYRQTTERVVFLEKREGRLPKERGDGIEAVPDPWGKGRQLANLGIPNALHVDAVRGDGAYPTEKPVELLEVLIRQSTEPGELVLDPCCGSGSAGEAALKAGRRVWLGDRSSVAVDRARARCDRALALGVRSGWPARFAPREIDGG